MKFQKRDPEICVPDVQKNIMRDTPWGHMSYLNYKKKIEFGKREYDEINKYCRKKKIDWFASAWDENSQKFLKQYNSKYNKIASAMITNISFLKLVASEKKKTFISTGMTNLKDIDIAVKIFRKAKCPFVVLHCVSTYPCPEDQLNLNLIPVMKKRYNCNVGYSGHESSVSPSIIAVSLGATSLERHITLDRSMYGSDQSASLEEKGFSELIAAVRKIPKVIGTSTEKKMLECEKPVAEKLRYWE